MKKTLFLVFSAAILVFSIISICTAPIINKIVSESNNWKNANCKILSDDYKEEKDKSDYTNKDLVLKFKKRLRNECNRKKAMYGLEYSALIINLFLGFICAILACLHYFDQAKYFEGITGIIGLATGIVGFILTLIYVCYSGYIFTHDPAGILKLDGEGAFAKKENGQFKCLFYKEKDKYSVLAKYSDLGKRQYNYQKKRIYGDDTYKNLCLGSSTYCYDGNSFTPKNEYFTIGLSTCDYLYTEAERAYDNKYIYDRWVTTIIFSCFIIVCDIGLAIFGFLLFKNSNGSGL